VPQSKVFEIVHLITQALRNMISVKSLRTLIGKVMSIATIIYVWRPIVQELYGALHEKQTNAPQGCV
jgi:hypothetical protein